MNKEVSLMNVNVPKALNVIIALLTVLAQAVNKPSNTPK